MCLSQCGASMSIIMFQRHIAIFCCICVASKNAQKTRPNICVNARHETVVRNEIPPNVLNQISKHILSFVCICYFSTKECKKRNCKLRRTNHSQNEKSAKKIDKARQHAADLIFFLLTTYGTCAIALRISESGYTIREQKMAANASEKCMKIWKGSMAEDFQIE